MVAYLERTQSIMVIQWSPTTRNTQYEYTVEYRIRISTLKALSKVTLEARAVRTYCRMDTRALFWFKKP